MKSIRAAWSGARPRAGALAARLGAGALTGALAAAVALAVGEAVAIFTGPSSAPVYAVGEAAVNLTPASLKEYAVEHFGERDKEMLIIGILAMLTAIALLAGVLALVRYRYGAVLIVLFSAVGVAAAVSEPESTWTWALPSVIGGVAALAALRLLVRSFRGPAPAQPAAEVEPQAEPAAGRRTFLVTAGAVAASSAAVGFGANLISSRRYDVSAARAAVRIPKPAYPAPALPAGVHPDVAGLSPFFTSNDDFYRVDTDLVLPQVSPDSWTLRIHGMVDRPIELGFADLLKQPLHEHDMTVSCVSDPVGGPYVGNARWIGASLPSLLRSAGVRSGADQLIAQSADGMTIGTPLASVLDGRNALLAVAMNGQALPIAHGFPARMLVPGFYGYASACKWVTDLHVTTFAAEQAYWVQRGYARIGTMKTQSRIDVPRPFAHLNAGPVTVAGIAWATDRGIASVQVQVDDQPWQDAHLAAADNPDTWRQWTYDWAATPGTHSLQVRAADDSGAYQPSAQAGPYPSGASGYESLVVVVA
ncbi:molybdopterin-dependent oxidoreductase [Actinospica sp. MGRD01-02]|uniref:Molybdopterin-dependent oxidoreductase n=1 Tax=Actinospica acidithermotolerans TaxID=2828514 RepID=A0A941EDL0_9ACTN|nr:molybdopterin-dependent oxidoreductase [Actinospica acidithermotolerans]MBR7828475.1 molybdopterin-dependent oxidoreductase [Actinospica acidithermotolerans]